MKVRILVGAWVAVAVGVVALRSRAGAHHQIGNSLRSSAVPVAENGGPHVQTVVLTSIPTATVTLASASCAATTCRRSTRAGTARGSRR